MRVTFLRQAYPTGGGVPIPAGKTVDLASEVLGRYPPDSFAPAPVAERQAETPRNKRAKAPKNK